MDKYIYKQTVIVCDKMIKLCKVKNKSFIDVFNELTKNLEKDIKLEILSLLPSVIASKGYEISNTNYFELKKY